MPLAVFGARGPCRGRAPFRAPAVPASHDHLLAENDLRPALETTGRHLDEHEDAPRRFPVRTVLGG
ncbi:hypothetical protein [Streptomyces sp. NPDC004266]|uniref:hypothetical protein n=1 Tax=Streptomyces sp. NPDC004266 TaxID=3364693 RepID=UPI0036757DF5